MLVLWSTRLRADHVSSYGYVPANNTELDRLAQQGVLFGERNLAEFMEFAFARFAGDRAISFEHGVGNVQPEPWLGWDSKSLGGYSALGEAGSDKGYRTGAFSANRTYFSRDVGLRTRLHSFRRLFSFRSPICSFERFTAANLPAFI